MTYEKYLDFLSQNQNSNESEIFNGISELFKISLQTVMMIWYMDSRSWFKPEMIDALILLDKEKSPEFVPNIFSGEFAWDDENKKFVPDEEYRKKRNDLLRQIIEEEKKDN